MLAAGTQLGPYLILSPLGAGGMGEVYRARDERLGRDVALKILPARFADDADRLGRFQREAQAVAALAHPNIVVVHDFGSDSGVNFTVSELLEGQTLGQRLAESPLPWRKAVELAVAIADGLAAAHAKGIIHRDIKPDNIFLTADERIKILDFGLAKLLAENPTAEPLATQDYSPALTQTGTLLGTAPYMSPEQLRAQPIDARSDIFSFGCVLYEMLAGRRPFIGQTQADMTAAILHNDPPELTASGKTVPVELERLVRRCLEKNQEARFQSARDLAFALRGIASSSAEVQPAPPQVRSRLYPWLAVGGMAVVVLVLAFVFWPEKAPSSLPSPGKELPAAHIEVAVLPFLSTTKDVDAEYLIDGLPNAVIKNLSEVGQLRVRSFSAGARFGTTDLTLGEIGRKLKVQALLTGRITARKDGIILTVELVNVADDNVVWSERYERKFADLQDIQLEIARQMCAKLKVTLTGEEEKRLARRYTNNPEAHKLYLIGRHHWGKANTESLKKAEQCFLQAIALDPNYALAHAGLADTYNLSVTSGRLPAKEFMPKARQAGQKALDLDGQLAEAHTAMGMTLFFYDRDWPAAEKMLKRGVQLNPASAGGFGAYHFYLLLLGRFDEAAKALEKAVQLDPLTPFNNVELAWQNYYSRQYDQAIEQGHKVLEVDPNFTMALLATGLAHLQKAEYAQGVAALEKLRQLDDVPIFLANLAYAYGVSGDHEKARKLLDEFNAMVADKKRYVDPLHGAIIHLGLGDKDQTCTWLEKAYVERSGFLVQLKAEPMFDTLRSEPRFVELMKKMNYP